jgi:hypothetical protein
MTSENLTTGKPLEASFLTLVLSIGSQAAFCLGVAPNPITGQIETDKNMARFNIDLLLMLKEKTQNNLSKDEADFLSKMITDLQTKYVSLK